MNITILIPYFGKLPVWIEYFIKSCEKNPEFKWILIGDFTPPRLIPENVKIHHMELAEFNQLSSEKLQLKINVKNPYKICDLRPAFGEIFNEYIINSEFWGYSDLDLIYGKISEFLDSQVFENYDVISCREEYFAGHFSLYRNMRRINHLYKKSKVFRKVFTEGERHYAFDERSNLIGKQLSPSSGIDRVKTSNNALKSLYSKAQYRFRKSRKRLLPDMNSVIRNSFMSGEIRLYQKDIVRSDNFYIKRGLQDWEILWKEGQLKDIAGDKSLLHFHFLKSKNYDEFKVSPMDKDPIFQITTTGIRCI